MDFDIEDATRTVDADAIMGLFPRRPRLLALGEPTHRQDTLLGLRNDLFARLAQRYGYRTIAIESDCLKGLAVDAYVIGGPGTLDETMERGFSHEWGTDQGNRELVRWMRAHNEDRPAHEQVRFLGFDGPLEITGAASPRRALTALHRFLAEHLDAALLPCTAHTLQDLLGSDERWVEPEAMMAHNLLAQTRRGPTLVYAHNSHLQRHQSSMRMWQGPVRWWSAGAVLDAHLGTEYAFVHTALGTLRHQGVETPPAHTIEGRLYTLDGEHHLVDPHELLRALQDAPLTPRESPWFGYAPLDPAHLNGIDGLAFVKDVT